MRRLPVAPVAPDRLPPPNASVIWGHTGTRVANEALHPHITAMQDTERFSETVSERKQRLEAAIGEALQREASRHEAAVKNMHRLRALRLERDQKAKRK